MDDLIKAIEKRRSRRKYLKTAMDPAAAESLQALIAELGGNGDRSIRLVLDDGDAFSGLRKSYGMLTGVQNYVALVGDKSDLIATEKLGYYGELVVLRATSLGLGTCWVGGTFDRSSCKIDLIKDESIICVITVGHVPPEMSGREKFIYRVTHRKTKTIDDMYTSDVIPPNWFLAGMKAVQKAPSAVNRQPVMFSYHDGIVTASVKDTAEEGYALDLGIAKLHFELGSGGGEWSFGNGAEFVRNR